MGKIPMFEKMMFSNRLGRITSRDSDYWKMIFNKVLKVGEEFEVHVPDNLYGDYIFNRFREDFRPTGNLECIGEHGVYDVKTDGSVPNGMELVTVGRRFNWKTFYDQNKKIMEKFQQHDFYTTHNTGMHIHLLAGYSSDSGTSELEKNVPELILANLYQLHRIFAPELFWIASGGATRYAITRYTLFRRPPFDLSPMNQSMRDIQGEMSARYGKYQMVNMNHVKWNGDGSHREISRFHVEIRHPDTHLSPAYSTALVALEVALLNKAIEISQCGIISMKQEEYDFRKNLFEKFANMGTGDRDSDSSELTDDDIKKLEEMSSDMIKWFKSEITSISPVAYEILKKIAVTPASMMRIGGKSWKMIEEHLYTPELVDIENTDKLIQIIVMQQITDCKNMNTWKDKASNRLSVPFQKVNELLQYLGKEKIVVFDKEIGAMMFKQIV
jgi:hypothetical protein